LSDHIYIKGAENAYHEINDSYGLTAILVHIFFFGAHAHSASIIRKGLEQNQSTPLEYTEFLTASPVFYTPQWHQYLFNADVCKSLLNQSLCLSGLPSGQVVGSNRT